MSMRVLVADDSVVIRKIIRRALERCGVTEVVEAADGLEAIAQFERQAFDLVLTDWNMPGRNGIDVLRAVRAARSAVPVILATTEAERSRVPEAVAASVTECIVKPSDTAAWLRTIDKYLASTSR